MTSSTALNQSTVRANRSGSRKVSLWFWIPVSFGVLVGGSILMLLITVTFGRVDGVEFSPDSFRRRSFQYYQLPLLGKQIWPISRTDQTGSLERRLVSMKYVTGPAQPSNRWDLITDNKTPSQSAALDAGILTAYFDASDAQGAVIWDNWTQANPALADVFWPVIIDLARLGEYTVMPGLFRVAETSNSATQLKSHLLAILSPVLLARAESLLGDGDPDQAIAYVQPILKLDPMNEPAETFRSRAEATRENDRDSQ